MEIKNVCATYVDKNENGIFTSFGMELNLKDETEIWKQLAEKGQLPSPTLDEQGFLDGFQNSADAMDVKIYEYGAVEIDFFAKVNPHQTEVVANIQEFLPAETVQELHHAIHEALTEHGYEEAKLMKPLIEKNQMNEYERLAAATDKTVLEISFVNEDMSKGDTIQKLEMDGYANVSPNFLHNNDPSFFTDKASREQMKEIADSSEPSEKMMYSIQHFKDGEPLDNPVTSVFESQDITKTLDKFMPEPQNEKNEYTK